MRKGRKIKTKIKLNNQRKIKKSKGLEAAVAREKVAREKWRNALQKMREQRQTSKLKINKLKQDAKRKIQLAQQTALEKATLKALQLHEKKAIAKEKVLLRAALKFDKKYGPKVSIQAVSAVKGRRGRGRPKKSAQEALMNNISNTPQRRGRPPKNK